MRVRISNFLILSLLAAILLTEALFNKIDKMKEQYFYPRPKDDNDAS